MAGRLAVAMLTWADPEPKSWDDFSADRERSIAREDAKWLAGMLKGVGSTTDTFTFPWGVISSGFDERAGFSSIRLHYA
jgi:hypothetical protein